jgi:hypothetical protein
MVRMSPEEAPQIGDGATEGDNERGAVLIVTAFVFIALMGVSALVIDIVTIHQARLRAQATADASVLAAALDLADVDTAVVVAKDYANRNFDVTDGDWVSCINSDALAVATTVPCISVNDEDPHTLIRVRIPDRRIPSFFGSVFGHDGFKVSATATAEVEFVVVSGGSSGPGVDPTTESVGDYDTGGWKTTATVGGVDCVPGVDEGCEGVSGYGEGCPANFWENHPAAPPAPPPKYDKKGNLKTPKPPKGGAEWRE